MRSCVCTLFTQGLLPRARGASEPTEVDGCLSPGFASEKCAAGPRVRLWQSRQTL
jgi:hypothetical protein